MALSRLVLLLLFLALPVWGETLHEAAGRGDMIRVIQILDGGAKLNGFDGNGNTALEVAVERKQVEIVRYLLERKAGVDAYEPHKGTRPLTAAVSSNNLAMVKLLVAAGANVNASADEFQPPLEVAVINGNLEIVRYLLEKKARANIKTSYGNLLHVIAQGREALYSGQKGRLEIAKVLVAYKVDPRERDSRGDLPFHSAVNTGHAALVDYFLDLGIKPDDKGSMAYAPLIVASEAGDFLTVQALLEHKANVQAASPEGSTALHKAAWIGSKKVVELLLRAGASPKVKNKAGKTPVDLAQARGHKAIVAMLKSK